VSGDDFKLFDDETMRRLRTIAQSPGEAAWRMELLAAMERDRIQNQIYNRNVMQLLDKVRKDISHITPMKLAELVNAQLEEKLKATNSDVNRLWKAGIWVLEKTLTIGLGAIGALIGVRAILK